MFDLLLTLVLVYLVYRGYAWYYRLQQQVKAGPQRPPIINTPPPSQPEQDDYIDYEEVE